MHTRELIFPLVRFLLAMGLESAALALRCLGHPCLLPTAAVIIVVVVIARHRALSAGCQPLLLAPAQVHVSHVTVIVQNVLQLLCATHCEQPPLRQSAQPDNGAAKKGT